MCFKTDMVHGEQVDQAECNVSCMTTTTVRGFQNLEVCESMCFFFLLTSLFAAKDVAMEVIRAVAATGREEW